MVPAVGSWTSRERMLYFVLERIGPSVIMTCLAQVIYHRDLAFTYITSRRDSSNLELLSVGMSPQTWRPKGRDTSRREMTEYRMTSTRTWLLVGLLLFLIFLSVHFPPQRL